MEEEVPWIGFEVRLEPHRVIDLICESVGDVVLDLLDGGVVRLAGDGWGPG